MKKSITVISLVLASLVYPIISSCGSNTPKQSEKTRELIVTGGIKPITGNRDTFLLPGENAINLTYDYVLPAMANTYENNANSDMSISGASVPTIAMSTLKKSDIKNLYNQAFALMGSVSGNYITAVEIFYGISPTNSLVYYFLPVCLQTSSSMTPPGTYIYTLTPSSLLNNNFSVYNATTGSINSASIPQFILDTTNYAQQMRISHYYGAIPNFTKAPNTSSNPMADTRYVIFPFQEIFHVLACNNVDSLTIFNAGIPASISGEYFTKHDLLLTPFSSAGAASNPMDEDLAHMVPPDYVNLSYNILSN